MFLAGVYRSLPSFAFPRSSRGPQVNDKSWKRRALLGALMLVLCNLFTHTAKADTFTFAPSVPFNGNGGFLRLFSDQHIGMRFAVTTTTNITHIGGHVNSENGSMLFGAIVRLDDQNASPVGWPTAPVVASTTFNPGFQGNFIPGVLFNDVLTPLSVTLEPGDYALVFGAGEYFGLPADSMGNMPIDSMNLGGASYIVWSRPFNTWRPFDVVTFPGNVSPRFVILSDQPLTAVPEPVSVLLFATGLAGVAGWVRKRR